MKLLIAMLVSLFLVGGMVGACATTTERPPQQAPATERGPQAP